MREIETPEEFDEVLNGYPGKLVVVDFHASWCGPCKMIGPQFAKMENDFPDAVFIKVDVDELEEVAEQYEVEAMPTFLMFRDSEKVGNMTGASADKLRETITTCYNS